METFVDKADKVEDHVAYSRTNPLFDMNLSRSDIYRFQSDDVKPQKPKRQWCLNVIVVYLILLSGVNAFLLYRVLTLESSSSVSRSEKLTSTNHIPLGGDYDNVDLNTLIRNNSQETKSLRGHLGTLQNQVSSLCGEEGQLGRLRADLGLVNVSTHRLEGKLAAISLLPGSPGVKGDAGQQGPKGEAGTPGSAGETGRKGDKGDSIEGRPGLRGEKGDSGPQGPPGEKGSAGPAGHNGIPGAHGPSGQTGPPGQTGPSGPPGAPGNQGPGAKGEKGDRGITGLPGPSGVAGAKGSKGDQGVMGITGSSGLKGERGLSGSPGVMGPPGARGVPGINGSAGPRGPAGSQGLRGPSGLAGQKGEKGSPASASNVRLVGGSARGRVEVFYNGLWGTVCDDSFDTLDGTVICRMLGFQRATTTFTAASGTGKIWLDDLRCTGTEINIFDCPRSNVGVHNCQHEEDAGVQCV
ncbi:uncharacterized protein marco [Polymixia lowei]